MSAGVFCPRHGRLAHTSSITFRKGGNLRRILAFCPLTGIKPIFTALFLSSQCRRVYDSALSQLRQKTPNQLLRPAQQPWGSKGGHIQVHKMKPWCQLYVLPILPVSPARLYHAGIYSKNSRNCPCFFRPKIKRPMPPFFRQGQPLSTTLCTLK